MWAPNQSVRNVVFSRYLTQRHSEVRTADPLALAEEDSTFLRNIGNE